MSRGKISLFFFQTDTYFQSLYKNVSWRCADIFVITIANIDTMHIDRSVCKSNPVSCCSDTLHPLEYIMSCIFKVWVSSLKHQNGVSNSPN